MITAMVHDELVGTFAIRYISFKCPSGSGPTLITASHSGNYLDESKSFVIQSITDAFFYRFVVQVPNQVLRCWESLSTVLIKVTRAPNIRALLACEFLRDHS